MSGEVNISFVLDMQRKLYRWSNEDSDKVFVDLFNLVCDRRTLNEAWRRLARNSGSRTPGTDGMTRLTVEQRPGGAAEFLEEIREALRNGTYCPEPVRQRLIPKPGKPGQFRPLGIPTLIDRLVQMALKLILEPIFEADFYPTSYGFRQGRSTHDALVRIQKVLHPTRRGPSVYRYVIEGDIKGCFDAIDHHVMMEGVRRRISDRKVLRLILAFLKAGVMIEGTVRHPVTGLPQGGIISPMLSNIYLTAIDERYGRWSMRPHEPSINAAARWARDRKQGKTAFYMVRYADDFVVPAGCSLAEVIGDLNPVILGWRNYYRYAIRAYREFSHLDYWIWQRVGRWLRRKHGKATWPMLRRRYYLSAPGQRRQWTEGTKRLRFLCDGGTMHYPDQSIAKPNGWTADGEHQQRESVRGFWNAFQRLRHIGDPPIGAPAPMHREPDAWKPARPVREREMEKLVSARRWSASSLLSPYSPSVVDGAMIVEQAAECCKAAGTARDGLVPPENFSREGALIRRADVRFAV